VRTVSPNGLSPHFAFYLFTFTLVLLDGLFEQLLLLSRLGVCVTMSLHLRNF